ncbi:MAG: CDP-glycerol glycerophosphotransferase family protein [bacterium]|nr:CDP-glycerol glycerophosphotransferase family protein [bacterium]
MNYTYYLKIKNILKNSKIDINQEIEKEKQKLSLVKKESLWGLTKSQKEYLSELIKISDANESFFRYLKLKKIMKMLTKKCDKKIRIVFFCYEYQTFPSFQSTYDKMKKDNRFVCDLVHIPFYHIDKKYNEELELKDYIKNGYSEIIKSTEYDLVTKSPDIAFFLKPYDLIPKEYYIDEIKQVINKSIYIPYGMEVGAAKESARYQFQLPLHDEAWMCISYCKEHYKRACKYSKQKGKNFQLIGHPRMDLIHYNFTDDKDYKRIKKKAKNRKIFMWNPHFTIEDGDNWGTFKMYGLDVLKYFANHKELFLLYRPHPLLKEALQKECDSNTLLKYQQLLMDNKDNIFTDESGNYLVSMHIADVLISDANSFVPEFLIYNKPVIYTKKPNTSGFKNTELESMVYTCNCKQDIFSNISNLNKNIDKLKLKREKDIKDIFKFDENIYVADKIISYITDYFNMEA